jgi:CheY-like chemotaxis protein
MPSDNAVRVLVVDDDEPIRDVLRAALEDEGYQVIEAPDGLIALEVLRAVPYPMVVLTNHNMPRLDGPGLVNFVVEDPTLSNRHIFIYMTAGNRIIPPTFARQLDELQVPVVRKPFNLDTLLGVIAEAAQRLPAAPLDHLPGHLPSARPDSPAPDKSPPGPEAAAPLG